MSTLNILPFEHYYETHSVRRVSLVGLSQWAFGAKMTYDVIFTSCARCDGSELYFLWRVLFEDSLWLVELAKKHICNASRGDAMLHEVR